ncbi:hypothetical protein N658DRAFT_144035 [Parathielavia hyrcaniae]|uniref:Uncharacterized protein n=1 Tax=Parathielavia hyrcaniae TaxID=113614 RepID=A0AAN6PXX5_9PEZI|nr:hypothetical protein N658DRAFT_144035 [Parathielavia hyrcaniae]
MHPAIGPSSCKPPNDSPLTLRNASLGNLEAGSHGKNTILTARIRPQQARIVHITTRSRGAFLVYVSLFDCRGRFFTHARRRLRKQRSSVERARSSPVSETGDKVRRSPSTSVATAHYTHRDLRNWRHGTVCHDPRNREHLRLSAEASFQLPATVVVARRDANAGKGPRSNHLPFKFCSRRLPAAPSKLHGERQAWPNWGLGLGEAASVAAGLTKSISPGADTPPRVQQGRKWMIDVLRQE